MISSPFKVPGCPLEFVITVFEVYEANKHLNPGWHYDIEWQVVVYKSEYFNRSTPFFYTHQHSLTPRAADIVKIEQAELTQQVRSRPPALYKLLKAALHDFFTYR